MSFELACKLVDDLARLTPSDRASQAVTISQKIKDAIEAATAATDPSVIEAERDAALKGAALVGAEIERLAGVILLVYGGPQENESAVDAAIRQMAELASRNHDLQRIQGEHEEIVNRLQSQVSSLTSEVSHRDGTISTLKSELASANARTAEVAARLDVASTELAELKAAQEAKAVKKPAPAAESAG